MSMLKNMQYQLLARQSMAPDSPLRRRSSFQQSINTSMPPPNSPAPSLNQTLNDDEAERRKSRRVETSVSEQETSTNLAEAADSLNNCLKLFAENKINKDNAWSINIIDSFAKLIQKHHHVLSNFQVAGTTLEASAKVYGLRVDSVYNDVCRMSADLARQTAKTLTKKGSRQVDEEEESDREQDNGNDKENLNNSNHPKVKKPKKRRNVSTITRNPDTLNARIETIPLTDPFFAKLNSVIGDNTSSKRLMQNIIPTEDSKLELRQNLPIWDVKEQSEMDIEEEEIHDPTSKISFDPTFKIDDTDPLFVRLGLANYRLSGALLERNEDGDNSFRSQHRDDVDAMAINNVSIMDLPFDINAVVEPVPLDKSIVMDYGDMDQDDFEDLNEMDLVAVDRCKGLKRQPMVIEDMQPETAASLEYSYRPLDIDQFWAGPSHWKFRQSRRTHLSLGGQSRNTDIIGTVGQRIKVPRKRKLVKNTETLVGDICDVDDIIPSVLVKMSPNMRGTQLTNQIIAKKWDPKKLKLPVDFKISLDIFDKFQYATNLHINSNTDVTFTGNDNDGAPYNYDNDNDRDYCSRNADLQSDTETETNTDIGQMDNNMEFDNIDMPPPPAPADEIDRTISDVFEGAPERIEKISIAFARRAKVVDMKQLKACSWTLISNKHSLEPLHNPKFSDMLKDLPKVLTRTMAENMSMPLAFYAMLHLCNDKGLTLNQTDELLKDFDVGFINV